MVQHLTCIRGRRSVQMLDYARTIREIPPFCRGEFLISYMQMSRLTQDRLLSSPTKQFIIHTIQRYVV